MRFIGSTASNAVANAAQMLFVAVLIFALYRYIVSALGIDQLGVWSVVLATVSASRLADLGLSAGVTRFVARDLALGLPNKAAKVVETGLVTLAWLVALVLVCGYPFLRLFLEYIFNSADLLQALEILPFALVSLWLTIAASVVLSGLDGCQRMVIRSVVVVLGQLVMVLLAYAFVPKWGLLGIAFAQIVQGLFLLIIGWMILRFNLRGLSIVPWRWNRPVFREMLGYGANVQAANVLMLLFDPLTKVLIAKFGGPAAAGFFEIANQIVTRLRALIVTANQAIVPRIAQIQETNPMQLHALYSENARILILIALPSFTLLLTWSGIIVEVLLKSYQTDLAFYIEIIGLAWLLNTLSSPAYFVNMGTGCVGVNTKSHILIGLANLVIGVVLGNVFGADGVVWSYVLALIIGSAYLVFVFHVSNKVSFRVVFQMKDVPLIIGCLFIFLMSNVGLEISDSVIGRYARLMLLLFIPLVVLYFLIWFHPSRKFLWDRFFRKYFN